MELKEYQQRVISDIAEFNGLLNEKGSLRTAFSEFWANKGIDIDQTKEWLHPYKSTISNVPQLTIKVPTAGGKTFIACNALRTIFDTIPESGPKVAAWFVPSDTILAQTYNNLSDPKHPYRQKLNSLFNGRVEVYDKPSLLIGQNFNRVSVGSQLSIFVLSIQSFASKNKEGRLVYRENENLSSFGKDHESLMDVIASLNPIVIIDESHNFTAQLRQETLQNLNPRYILELTATPRQNSNIISFVDASELKRASMVKLPVIVYNSSSVGEVIGGALTLQKKLENLAKENQDYIRPIVLFQAQPKTDEDNVTFDKIREKLVSIGIPQNQIAIKTAVKDELKGLDLQSPDCTIRYIITVDALKEGWDCPFAYILASLANRTSRISVEQILGRILRQPYAKQHSHELLNLAYVFTNSSDFHATLEQIIESLTNVGFSGKDYVKSPQEEEYSIVKAQMPEETPNLFSSALTVRDSGLANEDTKDVDEPTNDSTETNGNKLESNESGIEDLVSTDFTALNINEENSVTTITDHALKEAEKFKENLKETHSSTNSQNQSIMPQYRLRNIYLEKAHNIRLPQFYIKIESNGLFGVQTEMPLDPKHLLQHFALEKCDRNLSFESTSAQAVSIDLEERNQDEYVPKFKALNQHQLDVFTDYINNLSDENAKKKHLAQQIAQIMESKFGAIPFVKILHYVSAVVQDMPMTQVQSCVSNMLNTVDVFSKKIVKLSNEFKFKTFKDWLDLGTIIIKPSYQFPTIQTLNSKLIGIGKGMYEEEENVDRFEKQVISQIANLNNVAFWHRNLERGHGFCINGFINHYPDFIVVTTSGHILAVETKGDHLDGSDSENKIELGMRWAALAGPNYHYYMVFESERIPEAYALNDFIKHIKNL